MIKQKKGMTFQTLIGIGIMVMIIIILLLFAGDIGNMLSGIGGSIFG